MERNYSTMRAFCKTEIREEDVAGQRITGMSDVLKGMRIGKKLRDSMLSRG